MGGRARDATAAAALQLKDVLVQGFGNAGIHQNTQDE